MKRSIDLDLEWVLVYNDKGRPVQMHGPFDGRTNACSWAREYLTPGTWDSTWGTATETLDRVLAGRHTA